jgi:hypothetical protein
MVMTKKSTLGDTRVKMTPFARAGVTGKRPAKSGWSSFFGRFVRFLNSDLTSHFRFCLVRLMD